MTTERPELVFEGSNDGTDWREYEFPYKPGDLSRRPRWVAPHQPRLDWQLWFAALDPPEDSPWVGTVCELLLRGDGAVLGLFSKNPFPGAPAGLPQGRALPVRVHGRLRSAPAPVTGGGGRPLTSIIPPVSLPPESR